MENRGARLLLELAIGLVLLGILLLPRWMQRPSPRPPIEHVILVVLPRGPASEASIRTVANEGVLLANAHALAHPALPNRLALVSGSAWGVRAESAPPIDARHLGDLLDAKRLAWRVCADDGSLVPFAYFPKRPRVHPLADCIGAAGASQRFLYVTARSLPRFALRPRTLLIATIDEGRGDTNDILAAAVGDGVRAGAVSRAWYDHYSILRTVEELLGVGTLTAHDAKADTLRDLWR